MDETAKKESRPSENAKGDEKVETKKKGNPKLPIFCSNYDFVFMQKVLAEDEVQEG